VGATIFNGPRVKALKKIFGLNGGVDIISSTTDPTSVAVSASIGSLLLNESNGSAYLKQDAGSSTNWSQLTSGTPSVSATTRTVSQVTHGFVIGDVVFLSAANTFAKAKADADSTSEVIGVVHSVPNANSFSMTMTGRITGLSGLTAGSTYFLSPTTAGAITLTEPTTSGQISKPILVAESTTTAYVVQFRGAVIGGGGSAAIYAASFRHGSGTVTLTSPNSSGSYGGFSGALGSFSTILNENMGTISNGSGVPGFTFTPPVVGRYQIIVSTQARLSTGSEASELVLSDGTTNFGFIEVSSQNRGANEVDSVMLHGIYNATSLASTTIRLIGNISTGTFLIGAPSGWGTAAMWTIQRIN
jgi:hypothetical protein